MKHNFFIFGAIFGLMTGLLGAEAVLAQENHDSNKWPIGVMAHCVEGNWGISLEQATELGARSVQLYTPPKELRTPELAAKIRETLQKNNLELVAIIPSFGEESYASIQKVRETVGLVPPETREKRLKILKEISDDATAIGAPSMMFHLGAVPHDRTSSEYQDIVQATREACDYLAKNEQRIHLETGQETGEALLQFIKDVDRPNLFVNFDPGNMILYGCGDPIEAVRILGPYVKSIHCKDALWSSEPGEIWGKEVLFGTGDLHVKKFFDALKEIGYDGVLTIEREGAGGPDKLFQDLATTIKYMEVVRKNTLSP